MANVAPDLAPPPPRPKPVIVARAAARRGAAFPPVKGKTRRKRQFIRILLPIIVEENQRIRRERIKALIKATPLHYKRYGVKSGRRATLLRRIDTIPASLALAQAAIESGWGTSRFVREANNLYGQRTYNKSSRGAAPKDATGFKLVKFATITHSVRSYMRNLNTHSAYREFRIARKKARDKGEAPSGIELAKHLQAYSELREVYIRTIRSVVRKNNLAKYDHARLAKR